MTVMRLGLMRDLRKICQDFSSAMPRSTGARGWASARLTVCWVRVSSPPGRPSQAGGGVEAGARVGAVGEDSHALALAYPDDAMGASGGQIVGASRQGGRDPQHLADGIGDDLQVHPVPTVLGRVVGAAVADAVALGERPVQEDEVGVVFAEDLQQAGARPASRAVTAVT